MPGGVVRLADIFGPGGVVEAPVSPDVLVNGRPAALVGAVYTPHPCCGVPKCPPLHCFGAIGDIPSGVLVNGFPVLTKTGVGLCGHKITTASTDVIVAGSALAGIGSLLLSRALL